MILLALNADLPIPPPEEPDPVLGLVIRRLREERGLSRAELAERAQLDPKALAGIEAGVLDPPWTTVAAIARALDRSVEQLADAVVEQRAGGGDQ